MTNGSEADTMASDKVRHPVALKLFLSELGLELFSAKHLVCILNVILFPYRKEIILTVQENDTYKAELKYSFCDVYLRPPRPLLLAADPCLTATASSGPCIPSPLLITAVMQI